MSRNASGRQASDAQAIPATRFERKLVTLRYGEEARSMWSAPQIHVSLPEHLHASEGTDFLLIRCSLCHRSAWFSARGVSLVELKRTVEEHHSCPARAVTVPGARDVPGYPTNRRFFPRFLTGASALIALAQRLVEVAGRRQPPVHPGPVVQAPGSLQAASSGRHA